MAGVVPTKRSTSGRKQWTLHDGPRSSLKRLRSQLASDGCPESQVVLAKQLLDEQCEESQLEENARLGVYWLIKASEQGNLEATHLLKTCFDSGKGISEHNYMDVKSCITMTQDEKLARKAAREMFASLSNGGEFITSYQLQRKILSLNKDESPSIAEAGSSHMKDNTANGELVNNLDETSDSDEDTDWSVRSDTSNEKLTEDHLVAAAVNYSHGQLPIVSQILCLSDPDLKALDHVPVVHRSILHPFLALRIIFHRLIKFLAKKAAACLLPFTNNEFAVLFMLSIYIFNGMDQIGLVYPLLVYYATLIAMFVFTSQMLQTTREFHEFRLWSGLFICYSGGSINADQAEQQYLRNNLKPYYYFSLALIGNLFTYYFLSEQWLPHSELVILSFSLTIITLFGFMPRRRSKIVFDYLVLLSFGVNILAKYPYETDSVVAQQWRFIDLKVPTFFSYVISNGIECCLNFRVLLYMCIPFLFLRIAAKHKWSGAYNILFPHCVTLSWLQLCILSSQGATMFGLLRATLGLVGLVLFLPLVGITTILLPVFTITKWLMNSFTVTSVCLFIVLAAVAIGVVWVLAQSRYKHLTAFVQVFVAIFSVLVLINSTLTEDEYGLQKHQKYLTWDIFQRFCHQPVWENDNVAIAQVKCAELEGVPVHWDGYINDIKLKSISNPRQTFLNMLPICLKGYLSCLYGEQTKAHCDSVPDLVVSDCLSFYESVKAVRSCSLEKYNLYTFEITVRMASSIWGKSPEISLIADNAFYNFTMQLKPDDHIWFKGKLFNDNKVGPDGILGGSRPHINLDEIGCVGCHTKKLAEFKVERKNVLDVRNLMHYFLLGLKFVLNSLFNPVFVYK